MNIQDYVTAVVDLVHFDAREPPVVKRAEPLDLKERNPSSVSEYVHVEAVQLRQDDCAHQARGGVGVACAHECHAEPVTCYISRVEWMIEPEIGSARKHVCRD